MFCKISELNANSVDPDQMPHSEASDLGLHCLPISLLWDARLKWVTSQYCNEGRIKVYDNCAVSSHRECSITS